MGMHAFSWFINFIKHNSFKYIVTLLRLQTTDQKLDYRRDRINIVAPNRGVRQAKNVPIASRLLLFLIFIAYENMFSTF